MRRQRHGMRNLPLRTFEHHQIWLQSVARARSHLFDPAAPLDRRVRQGRSQAVVLPAGADSRPPRLSRLHRGAAPALRLAVGRAAHRGFQVSRRGSRTSVTLGLTPTTTTEPLGAARRAKRAHKPPPGPPQPSQRARGSAQQARQTSTTDRHQHRPEPLTPGDSRTIRARSGFVWGPGSECTIKPGSPLMRIWSIERKLCSQESTADLVQLPHKEPQT